MSTPDKATAAWLRERNPFWSNADISRSIARSHIIDTHPNWTGTQLDRAVAQQVSGESGTDDEPDDDGDYDNLPYLLFRESAELTVTGTYSSVCCDNS